MGRKGLEVMEEVCGVGVGMWRIYEWIGIVGGKLVMGMGLVEIRVEFH